MKVNTLDCTYVKNESVYDNFRRQVEWAIDQLAGYNEVVIQHHFLNGKDLEHNKRLLEAINETAFHEHCVFEGDFIFSMEGDNVIMKLKRYP